jgi:hypothetical protein
MQSRLVVPVDRTLLWIIVVGFTLLLQHPPVTVWAVPSRRVGIRIRIRRVPPNNHDIGFVGTHKKRDRIRRAHSFSWTPSSRHLGPIHIHIHISTARRTIPTESIVALNSYSKRFVPILLHAKHLSEGEDFHRRHYCYPILLLRSKWFHPTI